MRDLARLHGARASVVVREDGGADVDGRLVEVVERGPPRALELVPLETRLASSLASVVGRREGEGKREGGRALTSVSKLMRNPDAGGWWSWWSCLWTRSLRKFIALWVLLVGGRRRAVGWVHAYLYELLSAHYSAEQIMKL